jgi:hypothetical protein
MKYRKEAEEAGLARVEILTTSPVQAPRRLLATSACREDPADVVVTQIFGEVDSKR